MGLFTKKCAYCGMKLEDNSTTERMRKKFCSEKHADKYWEYKENSKGANGGC